MSTKFEVGEILFNKDGLPAYVTEIQKSKRDFGDTYVAYIALHEDDFPLERGPNVGYGTLFSPRTKAYVTFTSTPSRLDRMKTTKGSVEDLTESQKELLAKLCWLSVSRQK
ncbi:MAG: hypothetical protein JRC86_09355 [Deltaproteobacteria bacterium]|nr:hypothetical protein [Deltaproteobacteria bacterium]